MRYKNALKVLVIFTGLFVLFISGTGFTEETTIPDINNLEYQTGTIDRLAGDRIIIDDSLYKFAKDVQFLSRQGAKIETRWFKKGDKVRFVINNKNEALIIRKV